MVLPLLPPLPLGFLPLLLVVSDHPVKMLRPGMTPEAVRKLLGHPRQIGRLYVHRRYREQWYYELPAPIWVEFDGKQGQASRVTRIVPTFLTKTVNFLQPR